MSIRTGTRFTRHGFSLRKRIEEVEERYGPPKCPAPDHQPILDEDGQERIALFVREGDQLICGPCAHEVRERRAVGML
jgi:hypothetical protein